MALVTLWDTQMMSLYQNLRDELVYYCTLNDDEKMLLKVFLFICFYFILLSWPNKRVLALRSLFPSLGSSLFESCMILPRVKWWIFWVHLERIRRTWIILFFEKIIWILNCYGEKMGLNDGCLFEDYIIDDMNIPNGGNVRFNSCSLICFCCPFIEVRHVLTPSLNVPPEQHQGEVNSLTRPLIGSKGIDRCGGNTPMMIMMMVLNTSFFSELFL